MLIRVKVNAGSRSEEIVEKNEINFDISVKEKAEKNMANRRVLNIIKNRFPKKRVQIISGHHSPSKIISID